jgi:hypothetical protein
MTEPQRYVCTPQGPYPVAPDDPRIVGWDELVLVMFHDAKAWVEREVAAARDDEARKAADRVESLPYRDHGRTVNRNDAILAARRGLRRKEG